MNYINKLYATNNILTRSQAAKNSAAPPVREAFEHLAKKQKISTESFNGTLIAKEEINATIFAKVEMLSADNASLENYGNKHGNNVRMKRLIAGLNIPGIEVPALHGISTDQMKYFLQLHQLAITEEWEALRVLYENPQNFLEHPIVQSILTSIRKKIAGAFEIASHNDRDFSMLASKELISWLNNSKGHYLMVRSSGEEDSCHTANAGGNISRAYVFPARKDFCNAAKDVVCSYFETPSLRNLISAGVNPFEQGPKLAVTAQILIGESPNTKNDEEIPVSLVLFTTEPLYVGNDSFRTMRISATYGHGEGVVGGVGIATDTILLLVSESRPDHLYVLYDNSDKPVRLAPVYIQEGIKLQPVDNPESLRNAPVLNSELLSRLFTWGVIAEHFFGGNPTDLEIVIKGDTIYPVQARPVNRLGLTPTYLDVKGLAENPVEKTIRGEIVVPGRASVVEITSRDELCYAATLEEAERKIYDKKVHKAVIVTHPEPANSHPVVNFSGLGVPCLYVKNEISSLIQRISEKHPLLLCMQEGTVNLWDSSKGDPKSCIFSGYTAHPAKIAISLRSKTGEIPGGVKELLLRLRSAATHEAALTVLANLREHAFVEEISNNREFLAEQIQSCKIVPKQVLEIHDVLDQLIQKVEIAFQETEAALKKSSDTERLRPLFHVKVLDTLLSMLSVDPIVKDAKALINYQEKFNHPVHFASIYLAGDAAFEESSRAAWRKFLENLEPKATLNQIERLHSVIRTLESSGMLSTWFAFYFKNNTSLETVLQTFNPLDQGKLGQVAKLRIEIKRCVDNSDAFSKRERFKAAQDRLQTIVRELSKEDSLCALMYTAKPVTCMVILNALQEVVDLYDTAIKRMKASREWSSEEKVPLFKMMLEPYFELLQSCVKELKLSIPMHAANPIVSYMITMNKCFSNLAESSATDQLEPSRNFSVAAAAMGSGTLFNRHHPRSLEDFFTLTHQNLLVIISHCKNNFLSDDLIEKSALPQNLIAAIKTGKKISSSATRMGIDITEREIGVRFNIPLNGHSAQMGLKYDKTNGKMTVQSYLLGPARFRWDAMAFLTDTLNEVDILPLNSPIQISSSEVKFDWIARDEQTLQLIVQEIKFFCMESFDDVNLSSLPTRHKIDIHLLLGLTIKKFFHGKSYALEPVERFLREMLKQPLFTEDTVKALTTFIEKAIEQNDETRCTNALNFIQDVRPGNRIPKPTQEWIQHTLVALIAYGVRTQNAEFLHIAFKELYNRILLGVSLGVRLPKLFETILPWAKKYANDKDSNYLVGSMELVEVLIETGLPITKEITNLMHDLGRNLETYQNSFLSLVMVFIREKHPITNEIEGFLISLIEQQTKDKSKIEFDDDFFRYLERLVSGLTFSKLPVPARLAKMLISLARLGCQCESSWGREQSVKLFKSLLVANLGFVQAADAAEGLLKIGDVTAAFDLFDELVSKNQGFVKAAVAAVYGILHPDETLKERPLQLFQKLFKQGQGFDRAIAAAEKGVRSKDPLVNKSAVKLLLELNKHGKGVDKSLTAALLFASSPLALQLLNNVHLTATLEGKKGDLDQTGRDQLLLQVASAANKILNSRADEAIRQHALLIFSQLCESNKVAKNQQFYAHAFFAAEKGIEDSSCALKGVALKLFAHLVKVGYSNENSYRVMVAAAEKFVDVPSFDLRNKTLALFRELFKKGYGISQATAKAKKAVKNGSESIIKTAKKLLEEVEKVKA